MGTWVRTPHLANVFPFFPTRIQHFFPFLLPIFQTYSVWWSNYSHYLSSNQINKSQTCCSYSINWPTMTRPYKVWWAAYRKDSYLICAVITRIMPLFYFAVPFCSVVARRVDHRGTEWGGLCQSGSFYLTLPGTGAAQQGGQVRPFLAQLPCILQTEVLGDRVLIDLYMSLLKYSTAISPTCSSANLEFNFGLGLWTVCKESDQIMASLRRIRLLGSRFQSRTVHQTERTLVE